MLRFCLVVLVLSAATAGAQELAPHEKLMVEECNKFRARCGLPALKPAPWLMSRARQHCRWMLSNGMVHSAGVAENIAAGQPGVYSVTNTWINSSGHNANMRGGHTHIGVAGYQAPNGGTYWVQQFGGESGSPQTVEGGGSSGGGSRFVGRRIFGRFRR
jgi:uncharacterized protein YkwD